MNNSNYTTQNDLLLNNLMDFYKNEENLNSMLKIITGESKISLRITEDVFLLRRRQQKCVNCE